MNHAPEVRAIGCVLLIAASPAMAHATSPDGIASRSPGDSVTSVDESGASAGDCRAARFPPSDISTSRAPSGPGDLQYLLNLRAGGVNGQSLLTAPLETLGFTRIGAQTRHIYALDFDNAAVTLWGIDNDSRELGTLDLATGAFTPVVVTTGLEGNVTGLAFDPTTSDVSYVSTSTHLYTLNRTTGAATLVGAFGYQLVIDIAISNEGQIYGHDIDFDGLIAIDRATGAGTWIGYTGLDANYAQGMDFDPGTNSLYAWIYLGAGSNRLARLDLATGAATVLATGTAEENEGAIAIPFYAIFSDDFETGDPTRWSSFTP